MRSLRHCLSRAHVRTRVPDGARSALIRFQGSQRALDARIRSCYDWEQFTASAPLHAFPSQQDVEIRAMRLEFDADTAARPSTLYVERWPSVVQRKRIPREAAGVHKRPFVCPKKSVKARAIGFLCRRSTN